MAKRKRSAKQRANDKRLGAMARARGRKSSTKRKSLTRRKTSRRVRTKVITKIRRVRTMARRRSAPRRKSGLFGGKTKTIGKAIAIGAGTGVALNLVGSAIGQPSIASNPIIGALGAFFLGGPIAGGVALLSGGALGGILGGGNGNTQSMDGLA